MGVANLAAWPPALRGPRGAQFEFTLAAIAQNLRRLAKLVARSPPLATPGGVSAGRVGVERQRPHFKAIASMQRMTTRCHGILANADSGMQRIRRPKRPVRL